MKKWLITAGCLMAAGLILFTVGLSIAGFDFTKLGTKEMVTNTYTVSESYTNISVDAITADIAFAASEEGIKVVCYEDKKLPFSVCVENETLVISCKDNRKWYDHIGFNWEENQVTVYLPAGEYGDLQINCTTGDVTVPEGFSFRSANMDLTTGDINWKAGATNTLSAKTTTGAITVEKVQCDTLNAKTTTGNVTLTDVVTVDAIHVQVSTGDVKLNRADAGQLQIKATTGDVTGTILSEKVFDAKATTGDVTVPQSTTGGICRVTTTTGDIHLKIAE